MPLSLNNKRHSKTLKWYLLTTFPYHTKSMYDWQRNDRCMVMRFFWVKQSLVRKGQRHRDQRPSCKIFMCCKWWAHLNGHTEKKVSHNNGLLKRSKHTLTHSICNEMRREWRAGYSWGDNCQWHRTLPPHSHSHRTQAYFCLFCNKSLCLKSNIEKISFWNL